MSTIEINNVADCMRRLRRCLRHTSDQQCCGTPMLHGTIELGEPPITACLECGRGLPEDIAAECGISKATPATGTLSTFECWHKDFPEGTSTFMARTLGGAKSRYHRQIREPWPDVPFTDLRGRRLAGSVSSPDFIRCATYRGLPNLRVGHRITLGNGARGTVSGHDRSANFKVIFDQDSPHYAGLELSVHPHDFATIEPA